VIRVVVAENQVMMLGALATMLDMEHDIAVIGRAVAGVSARDLVLELVPDVLVADIEMPGLTGIAVAQQIAHARCPTRVLIVTTFGRPGYLRQAMDAGITGYLLKDTPIDELTRAVRTVAGGWRAIAPDLMETAWSAGSDPLSEREREVLRLAEDGLSNKQIARQLQLSPGTVRNHLSKSGQKLLADNRIDAVRIAQRSGWL
jgi:two-component system, NarL family, response regulator DesR